MISYDIYLFHYYSFSSLISRCDFLGIEVKKYYIYGSDYYLKIPRKDRKKVKENFHDYKIVSKIGVINFFELLITRPLTLISLILSVFLFMNLSIRMYDIEIVGDYPYIESYISEYVNELGIKKYEYSLSKEKIEDLENKIKEKFNDELEFVEIIKEGAKLSINYKKRRKVVIGEGNRGSIYASKDGVIKEFKLEGGVKQVKVNSFVRKGDLLVSDIIINNNKEEISIDVKGSVYALTYYFINIDVDMDIDDASKYMYLLDKARVEVSKNINSEEEYIYKEDILFFDLEKGEMKVYYILYEDITI